MTVESQDNQTNPLNLGLSCLFAKEGLLPYHTNPANSETSRISCAISCVSRLTSLRRLRHPNLARYIDAKHDKHTRIYVVTEHYTRDFQSLLRHSSLTTTTDFVWLCRCLGECLSGLQYLASQRIVYAHLSPGNILIDREGHVKLAGYGIFYASRWGLDINFPEVDVRYYSPEMLLRQTTLAASENGPDLLEPQCPLDNRSDLWSLGLIFAEIVHFPLSKSVIKPAFLLSALRRAINTDASLLTQFGTLKPIPSTEMQEKLDSFCEKCLILDARRRPVVRTLCEDFKTSFSGFLHNQPLEVHFIMLLIWALYGFLITMSLIVVGGRGEEGRGGERNGREGPQISSKTRRPC